MIFLRDVNADLNPYSNNIYSKFSVWYHLFVLIFNPRHVVEADEYQSDCKSVNKRPLINSCCFQMWLCVWSVKLYLLKDYIHYKNNRKDRKGCKKEYYLLNRNIFNDLCIKEDRNAWNHSWRLIYWIIIYCLNKRN